VISYASVPISLPEMRNTAKCWRYWTYLNVRKENRFLLWNRKWESIRVVNPITFPLVSLCHLSSNKKYNKAYCTIPYIKEKFSVIFVLVLSVKCSSICQFVCHFSYRSMYISTFSERHFLFAFVTFFIINSFSFGRHCIRFWSRDINFG
jgi:hypothetical protein